MIKKLLLFIISLTIINNVYAEKTNKVIFDESHMQAFVISKEGELQLSNLAKVFKEEGLLVSSNKEPITKNILKNIESIVISGPFKEITKDEIEELYNFVNNGGNLIVMLHISPPAIQLFEKFGVTITKGSISEMVNLIYPDKNLDFEVKNFSYSKLFNDITKFSVYGSWGLISIDKNVNIIAKTSEKSWIDLNRNGTFDENEPKGPFGIIAKGRVGNGNFIFFADDAIFQNKFLKDENLTLAKNLAKLLKEGF